MLKDGNDMWNDNVITCCLGPVQGDGLCSKSGRLKMLEAANKMWNDNAES